MTTPRRIQRKRTKGWRMPDGAVYVGRPTKWGNPFRSDNTAASRAAAVYLFRLWTKRHPEYVAEVRAQLAGRDLACWCSEGSSCHADVLLEIANPVLAASTPGASS